MFSGCLSGVLDERWYRKHCVDRRAQLPVIRELEAIRRGDRYKVPGSLIPHGCRIYSQTDEDGIIMEIFRRIGASSRTFVEFGVGDGLENNTLALLFDGWRGLWIEGTSQNVKKISRGYAEAIQQGLLTVVNAFITVDNIDSLISSNIDTRDIDLLSVDIDGNDWHILGAITCIKPRVICVEYNAKFPPPIEYCMAYDQSYVWKKDDNGGASLRFLEVRLAERGYSLVGCTISGVNAFFVRNDLLRDKFDGVRFQEPFTSETFYEPPRYYFSAHWNGHVAGYNTLAHSLRVRQPSLMAPSKCAKAEPFDMVVPLHRVCWSTRTVLEGISAWYAPRAIHIIAPREEVERLRTLAHGWALSPLKLYEEESFFDAQGLSKEGLAAELPQQEGSLYMAGWFYQQLLKLGAPEGIPEIGEWYCVWDSDMVPVEPWPLLQDGPSGPRHTIALVQHRRYGGAAIVAKWHEWIRQVLGVEVAVDSEATFVPHHMWFKREHLASFKDRLRCFFGSEDAWQVLMMRSVEKFGTFSEYWAYASWVAATAPDDLAFHPYAKFGVTNERFFDDGERGLLSAAMQKQLSHDKDAAEKPFMPSHEQTVQCLRRIYGRAPLPSTLNLEQSERHLKKGAANMHLEELRSRWKAVPNGNAVSNGHLAVSGVQNGHR